MRAIELFNECPNSFAENSWNVIKAGLNIFVKKCHQVSYLLVCRFSETMTNLLWASDISEVFEWWNFQYIHTYLK